HDMTRLGLWPAPRLGHKRARLRPVSRLVAIAPRERRQSMRRGRQKLSDKQLLALPALADVTLSRGRNPPPDYQLPQGIKVVEAGAWQEELKRSNVLDGNISARRAASACGRSRPCVSEIAPMVRIMPDQPTRGAAGPYLTGSS